MKSFFKTFVQSRIESSGSESLSTTSESYNPNLLDDLVSTPHNQLVLYADFGGSDLRRTSSPDRSTPHVRLPVELVDISDDDKDNLASIVPVKSQQVSMPMSAKVPRVLTVASRLTKRKRDTPSEKFLSQKQQKGKGVVVSSLGRSDLFHEFKFSSPLAEQRTQCIQTAGLVDEEVARYLTDGRVQNLQNIAMNKFSENCKSLFKISCRNWSPQTNEGYASIDRGRLVYRIAHKMPIDFGEMVYDHVLQLALMSVSKFFLMFPSLIYRLIQTQHPDIQILRRTSASASQGQSTGRKVPSSTAPATSLGQHSACCIGCSCALKHGEMMRELRMWMGTLIYELRGRMICGGGYINGGMLEYQTQSKRWRLKMHRSCIKFHQTPELLTWMQEQTWQAVADDVESQEWKLAWRGVKDKIHREDIEDIVSKNTKMNRLGNKEDSISLDQCHDLTDEGLACWAEPSLVPECLLSSLKNLDWEQYDGTEVEEEVAASYILKQMSKGLTFALRK
uniref:F28J9.1 n=1 Tax=Arabidopsis thaliana TaxID=3702 RepID=Q9S9S8_ARATH|nr:F28J9.1 [Arabidopsis thaliana]